MCVPTKDPDNSGGSKDRSYRMQTLAWVRRSYHDVVAVVRAVRNVPASRLFQGKRRKTSNCLNCSKFDCKCICAKRVALATCVLVLMLCNQMGNVRPRCVQRKLYTAGRVGPVLWQRASVAEPAPGGAEGGGARGLLRGSPRDPLGRPAEGRWRGPGRMRPGRPGRTTKRGRGKLPHAPRGA